MKNTLGITALFMAASLMSLAQRVQLGIQATGNVSIYQHGRSFYSGSAVRWQPTYGGGLMLPLRWNADNGYGFQTGLGAQLKSYSFEQHVSGSGYMGYTSLTTSFLSLEIPVLLTRYLGEKSWKREYSVGLIASYNMPQQQTLSGEYEGTRAPLSITQMSPEPDWSSTFSPDLYAGFSFVHFKNDVRDFQVTLSYQHGLIATDRVDLHTMVGTSTVDQESHAFLRPVLSGFNLSVAFWPAFLNFGGANTAEQPTK